MEMKVLTQKYKEKQHSGSWTAAWQAPKTTQVCVVKYQWLGNSKEPTRLLGGSVGQTVPQLSAKFQLNSGQSVDVDSTPLYPEPQSPRMKKTGLNSPQKSQLELSFKRLQQYRHSSACSQKCMVHSNVWTS